MSKRDTIAVTGVPGHDPGQKSVVVPIHQTTTFALDEAVYDAIARGDVRDVWLYTRYGNPTTRAVEDKIAALEGTESALLLASGMAAISTTLFALTRPGGILVAPPQLYG